MRLVFICAVWVCMARAALVQGVVLDEDSGSPLARTLISLIPLPGTEAAVVNIRTTDRGAFSILSVRPGWYVLRSARAGFETAEAGQLRPGRPGTPFEVTADDRATFLQVRMKRMASISGAVLDENNVGIPDWPVQVYTARKPIRRIAAGKTDDRGLFRIGALEPGTYLVRSNAGLLDEETPVLPTYYKYGTAVESAEPVRVRVGDAQQDIAIRPVKGRLLEISGVFSAVAPARLSLITDTGRKLISSVGPPAFVTQFTAQEIPPGPVELLAEGQDCGGYSRFLVDRDMSSIRIACGPLYPTQISWSAGKKPINDFHFPLLARRVDLDGTGPAHTMKRRENLPPGHWELMAETSAQYYTVSISANGAPPIDRYDGWFGIDAGNQSRIQIELSMNPASVSGVVSTGGKPVAGASVYLELIDPEAPGSRLRLTEGRADPQGMYRFSGLTPGRYRVLSSFDFDPDDRFAMERAPTMQLREGDNATQPLEMFLP